MKKILLLVFCSLISFFVSAQAGEWVWLHGSSSANSAGSYGTQGTPAAGNDPPANYEPAEWMDNIGNFWFYGGLNSSSQAYNDLWKYNPASNQWTWMNGTATPGDPGSYGTQGVTSPSNRPPALGYAATTWVDLNGNFWLFGGFNTGNNWYYSDLWEYKTGTNEWTWMKGPGTMDPNGVYGTQGVANAANYPRSRTECATAWTDNSGNLWLFGAGNGALGYNDLWKYNISTNEWTWMKGVTTSNPGGVYGTKGVEAAANTPGGRWSHSRWVDNNDNLYLFGGAVMVDSNFNDLWRYNITTDNWAWMNGKSTPNDSGFYGTKCVTTVSNLPWSRYENRTAWTDPAGNFWMFGGDFEYNPTSIYYVFNDLWMYCVTSNEWTWESGDSTANPAGNWGTMGVTSATNKPNARNGSIGWTDGKWHLYMFGGAGSPFFNHYNDIWKYTIDTICGVCASGILPPVASLQASDTTLCANDCISFSNLSTNATAYQWTFAGAIPATSTDENPQSVCYLTSGMYNVKLVAFNSGASDSVTFINYINVKSAPPTPVITQAGTTLYCSTDSTYTSYQWFDSTALIPGATDTFLVISQGGNYNVQVANKNGCKIAVGITVILSIQNYPADNAISLSPNPATNQITIHTSLKDEHATVSIINVLGQKVFQSSPSADGFNLQSSIDVSKLAAGIYFLQLKGESGSVVKKFVKE